MNTKQAHKKLLKEIQTRLVYGDIQAIADATGFSREYVGKVLNPNTDRKNKVIVDEAVKIIEQRKFITNDQLKVVQAA